MRLIVTLVVTVALAFAVRSANASLALAEIFGDRMVLQQQIAAPIWGWARPGATVVVKANWSIAGDAGQEGAEGPESAEGVEVMAEAFADEDGRWMANLATPAAGGPYIVTVTSDGATRTLRDVLIGEVWLCGGQSNMEWPLRASAGGAEAIASADRRNIRLFTVENTPGVRPSSTFITPPSGWRAMTPETAAGFSAVASHFACSLQDAISDQKQIPIGLIQADWGGTRIEAWMPADALRRHPRFQPALDMLEAFDPDPAIRAERLAGFRGDWWSRLDTLPGGAGADWAAHDIAYSAWSPVTLPATFAGDGLENFDGVVYFRRTVELPAAFDGAAATIELGPIDDRDEVFVNGTLVGGTRDDGRWATPRRYAIPAGVLAAGNNTIAIRVLDTAGPGGVNGSPEQMRLVVEGAPPVRLDGAWRMRRGAAQRDLPPMDSGPTVNQNTPTGLWNGMIAPLVPLGVRGAIWYQGESNRYDPALYAVLFKDLIRAWRDRFGDDLAFHFVQIAPFAYPNDRGETAVLREAQAEALALPDTGMVVTLDIGDPNDIHPAEKRVVGERLAALALRETYGRRGPTPHGPDPHGGGPHGPRFSEATIEDGAIRVHFDHLGGGLVAGGDGLLGFSVAREDRLFHEADAAIEGESVVVRSKQVPTPAAVRYAWSAAPRASLFDAAGLPAAPFRSDDWATPEGGWPVPRDVGATRWLLTDPTLVEGFVPLCNGEDLTGWVNINCAPETFTVRDGMIHCTGKPICLLRTEEMYENFVLELEWRHLEAKGNAGLFVWSDALTAPGTPFSRAIEVQVMVGSEADWYTSDGDIFPIHGATMTPLTDRVGVHAGRRVGSRAYPIEARMRPSGEWNHYLLTCDRGEISLAVNGKVVTRGRDASPRKGYICLESEGTPIEFRNLRIRELPPASPPLDAGQVALAADGWRPLYTGIDLQGWKHDAATLRHWQPADWVLRYDGKGGDLWTEESFGDFELIVDWRLIKTPVEVDRPLFGASGAERRNPDGSVMTQRVADAGDSGIYLRGGIDSQVNIWSWPCGSGEVWGYRTNASMPEPVRAACTPSQRADNPPGAWNRFHVMMKGDRLTVRLNGKIVIDGAELPGVATQGPIGLQNHGDPVEFASIFIREL